jgi:hypothetical protein
MPVYDTQCGAKLFRVTDTFRRVFTQPFVSQWIFDVEILARLATEVHTHNQLSLRTTVYEWPLQQWHDVKGSKIQTANFLRAAYDLLSIYRRYRRFLRAGQGGMELCPDAARAVSQDLTQADTKNTEVATGYPDTTSSTTVLKSSISHPSTSRVSVAGATVRGLPGDT